MSHPFRLAPRRRAYLRAAYLCAHGNPFRQMPCGAAFPRKGPRFPFPDATESRYGGRDMPPEPSMRTAVFSARPYDRHFLEEAAHGWQPPIFESRGQPGFPGA